MTSGRNNATVDTFTTDTALSGTFWGAGKVNINIGATLHVAASQAAGNYSGTFDLTCEGFSATANATITVAVPISISAVGNLDFGTMVTTGPAGPVTVPPAGARSPGTADPPGGAPSAASCAAPVEGRPP